jgi:hypothetical protein
MKDRQQSSALQGVIMELEKRYPYFKKMDIFATVSGVYKRLHKFFSPLTEKELEEIKNIANRELSL